jgi:hypothetical protein
LTRLISQQEHKMPLIFKKRNTPLILQIKTVLADIKRNFEVKKNEKQKPHFFPST